MARTLVDASVFSEPWFKEILQELVRCKHVTFSFAPTKKFLGEHEHARKLGQFYKLMGDQGRRIDAEGAICERHERKLSKLKEWVAEPSCDDPHIFAVVYEKPTRFIFTSDGRLAKCRTCINRVVDKRYCAFKLVKSAKNYQVHRLEILGA